MKWSRIAREAPGLAARGVERLEDPGVVLVGTLRRDGAPRISPVEPLLWDDDLWLSMLWASVKARDLQRDPRLLVHSIVTSRDGAAGEFKVRGRAVEQAAPEVQARYADEVRERVGWSPVPGRFHLFAVDIDDVTFIRYDEATGDQFVARWPPGEEFVRRGTSATSLGGREPYRDLLRP